ncbi:hypothetical protein B0H15DRAFT_844534 [Mycena belliarum]|uniref:Uncharacterized protein n=1 Tax=Mycena belliarum TaxID=1033014 RepID=A0AAD6XQ70_9AGAR|nr:hypothetical protein B0H15DRAFT_844534 [Mycena belliae]
MRTSRCVRCARSQTRGTSAAGRRAPADSSFAGSPTPLQSSGEPLRSLRTEPKLGPARKRHARSPAPLDSKPSDEDEPRRSLGALVRCARRSVRRLLRAPADSPFAARSGSAFRSALLRESKPRARASARASSARAPSSLAEAGHGTRGHGDSRRCGVARRRDIRKVGGVSGSG